MKNNQYKLEDIADIRSGYSFRSKLESEVSGNVLVVQLKELSEKNTVDLSSAVRITMDGNLEDYLLKKDDIIFRNRGSNTNAAIMNVDSQNVILAAPFQRIRIKDGLAVLPEYLLWFINSDDSQSYFAMNKMGTSVSMISNSVLSNLKVIIPPLDLQEKIVEITRLAEKEKELQEELIKKKDLIIKTQILNATKNSEDD